ncbi:hypothetical protein TNIN_99681 [Trichonephila inaurata madagascariensis]|uniref:Uncharacterized protein n=1 Tax=Trichonephila inaurata madagascariensis TaxID=2747483 RepID=A0A8X7CMK0_9ARAC|nr:hypothetical protein TNIN_99681 [Trichonephila inaurata madagascariensis]
MRINKRNVYQQPDSPHTVHMTFVNMYNNDEDLILQRRKEFESDLDIQKTIKICRGLCLKNESNDSNQQEANKTTTEQNL